MKRLNLSTHTGLRKQFVAALLAINGLVAAGCAVGADQSIEASLDEPFRLKAGESAEILPERVRITMVGVSADSRCGKGETCIWEGDAVVQINVHVNGVDLGLHEVHTNEREGRVASFGEFHVRLIALSPPAASGKAIRQDEYVAMFRLGRGYAGNNGLQ